MWGGYDGCNVDPDDIRCSVRAIADPEPIPKAIVTSVLGITAPKPLVVDLPVGFHPTYGGVFGVLLARFTRTVTVLKGASLGVVLWLLMQLGILPVLGWGIFGTTVTPKIAVATLVLHLVYGVVLGRTLGIDPTRPGTSGPEGVN